MLSKFWLLRGWGSSLSESFKKENLWQKYFLQVSLNNEVLKIFEKWYLLMFLQKYLNDLVELYLTNFYKKYLPSKLIMYFSFDFSWYSKSMGVGSMTKVICRQSLSGILKWHICDRWFTSKFAIFSGRAAKKSLL